MCTRLHVFAFVHANVCVSVCVRVFLSLKSGCLCTLYAFLHGIKFVNGTFVHVCLRLHICVNIGLID